MMATDYADDNANAWDDVNDDTRLHATDDGLLDSNQPNLVDSLQDSHHNTPATTQPNTLKPKSRASNNQAAYQAQHQAQVQRQGVTSPNMATVGQGQGRVANAHQMQAQPQPVTLGQSTMGQGGHRTISLQNGDITIDGNSPFQDTSLSSPAGGTTQGYSAIGSPGTITMTQASSVGVSNTSGTVGSSPVTMGTIGTTGATTSSVGSIGTVGSVAEMPVQAGVSDVTPVVSATGTSADSIPISFNDADYATPQAVSQLPDISHDPGFVPISDSSVGDVYGVLRDLQFANEDATMANQELATQPDNPYSIQFANDANQKLATLQDTAVAAWSGQSADGVLPKGVMMNGAKPLSLGTVRNRLDDIVSANAEVTSAFAEYGQGSSQAQQAMTNLTNAKRSAIKSGMVPNFVKKIQKVNTVNDALMKSEFALKHGNWNLAEQNAIANIDLSKFDTMYHEI